MKKYHFWRKLMTASLLLALLSAPSVQAAETRKPIEKVNLYVDGDRNDGWNEDITLKLSTPDSEYGVGDWYLSNSNTASVPIFKVELYAKTVIILTPSPQTTWRCPVWKPAAPDEAQRTTRKP